MFRGPGKNLPTEQILESCRPMVGNGKQVGRLDTAHYAALRIVGKIIVT